MTKYQTGYHPDKNGIDSDIQETNGHFNTLVDNVNRHRDPANDDAVSVSKNVMDKGLAHLKVAKEDWKNAVDEQADFTDETRDQVNDAVDIAKDATRESKNAADSLAEIAINNGSKAVDTLKSDARHVAEVADRIVKKMQASGKSYNDDSKDKEDSTTKKRGPQWRLKDNSVRDPFYSGNKDLKADKDALKNGDLQSYKGDTIERIDSSILDAVREPGH